MHKLEIKLKQHTPLIHFQHDQEGATLRASEVKPKLDKFILTRLGNGEYLAGINIAKDNGWLIGRGEHPALNYKLRIEAQDRFNEVKLSVNTNNKGKYYTFFLNVQGKEEGFPFLLANMGGKDTEKELMNLSQFHRLSLTFLTTNANLVNEINNNVESFFALNNFGQRETKGFGSFSVIEKCLNDQNRVIVNWKERFNSYYENGTPVFKFPLNVKDNEFEKQLMLFSVIDFYWKCLKSGVNYTKRIVPRNGEGDVVIRNKERYIKAFLWSYLNSKGYTWEKRKIKNVFHLETSYPERSFSDNPNCAIFARGMMGCPDKYEYRIPQNHFTQRNGKYKEDVKTYTISVRNEAIDRISSPIIFKPIVENENVSIYVLFDFDLIHRISTLPEASRRFSFIERNHIEQLDINPNCIDYKELIRKYHFYLFTNSDFLRSTLGYYDRNSWQSAQIKLSKDKDGKIISRNWGETDMSWKMVPRNFSWENILDPNDNGQKKYVSFSQVIRRN